MGRPGRAEAVALPARFEFIQFGRDNVLEKRLRKTRGRPRLELNEALGPLFVAVVKTGLGVEFWKHKTRVLAALVDELALVKLDDGRALGDSDGASICVVTVEVTINVGAVTVDSRAVGGLDLDVVVWSILVVRVWNQRQIGVAVGVARSNNQRSPVTNTRRRVTPDTSVLDRDTGIVNVVLSRSLASLPVVVVVLIDNTQWSLSTGLQQGWNNHVLGTWVVGSAESNILVDAGLNVATVVTPLTQVVGVGVRFVEVSVFAVETTDRLTVGWLGGWVLGFRHTCLTSVRTVESVLTRRRGGTILLHDGSPSTESKPVDGNDTLTRWEVGTFDGAILKLLGWVRKVAKVTADGRGARAGSRAGTGAGVRAGAGAGGSASLRRRGGRGCLRGGRSRGSVRAVGGWNGSLGIQSGQLAVRINNYGVGHVDDSSLSLVVVVLVRHRSSQ
ncbi:hypothetical protein OGATHE_003612 [Ogataea polymorpha]|uniref:Uncharacterized protein n=1 Tax=Ogataea polymorpha TaxID=460523 RepID=A0A9P8P4L0_9ASCO|nr:hypothetical protein OGATHE_003612 [Ogataea polymorpha]